MNRLNKPVITDNNYWREHPAKPDCPETWENYDIIARYSEFIQAGCEK